MLKHNGMNRLKEMLKYHWNVKYHALWTICGLSYLKFSCTILTAHTHFLPGSVALALSVATEVVVAFKSNKRRKKKHFSILVP